MKKNIIAAFMLAAIPLSGFAWGQKGHDVVAKIAENHLTPVTLKRVSGMLDGKSIVYWANWLDNASHTPEYAHSKTWHYRNIDAGQDYETAPRNPSGDVVSAINAQIEDLQSPRKSPREKNLALKMLVHLVGDLHQPMHMGHLSDLGGNRVTVKYFGRDKKLHGVWDTDLVESAHKWSYTEWADQLDRADEETVAKYLDGTTPDSWGRETFDLATMVYEKMPEGTNISYNEIEHARPIVETQLLKGGLRLADTLNSIFDPDYKPRSKAVNK